MTRSQLTLAGTGFAKYTKVTRLGQFLAEMNRVVPWRDLCARIEPVYPKAGNGRPLAGLERMLRMYFLQHWFNLSDPAVNEALYDSPTMRAFVGIDLGRESAPDETTVCKFCHLLEQHGLGRVLFDAVTEHLRTPGVMVSTGTIVDATIIAAPPSTKIRPISTTAMSRLGCCTARNGARGAIRRTRGKPPVLSVCAPHARDFTHRRATTPELHATNRWKSRIRARVEHPIGVIRRVFGFTKVCYRRLAKNRHRLEVAAALVNLFILRKRMLRLREA